MAGYIVEHYCLTFDRGVVHIVVTGDIVDNYYLLLLAKYLTITV